VPTINQAGLTLIKTYEGCRLEAYQDPGGVWTIGYGHTGNDVHEGMVITQDLADAMLDNDLLDFEACVNNDVERDLTPNQFAACVSLAYNIGCPAFSNSTVLRKINAGNFPAAADAFSLWVHVDGTILPGLVARRKAEAALFAA
jgi:lysozyme